MAVVASPSLSWVGPTPEGAPVHHLALSTSHHSCCGAGERARPGPCPCSPILPMASLHHCGNLHPPAPASPKTPRAPLPHGGEGLQGASHPTHPHPLPLPRRQGGHTRAGLPQLIVIYYSSIRHFSFLKPVFVYRPVERSVQYIFAASSQREEFTTSQSLFMSLDSSI